MLIEILPIECRAMCQHNRGQASRCRKLATKTVRYDVTFTQEYKSVRKRSLCADHAALVVSNLGYSLVGGKE